MSSLWVAGFLNPQVDNLQFGFGGSRGLKRGREGQRSDEL